MLLEKIILQNYRNYQKADISFHPNVNIFLGENAQGKTNLLEAIYFLATANSFRNNSERDIIKWEEDFFRIQGFLKKANYQRDFHLEIVVQAKKAKEIRINSLKKQKISELLGYLQVILFSPEDLRIIKDGPSERRRYIDLEIMQLKTIYYDLLRNYKKVLQQRNSLLKEIRYKRQTEELLSVFNSQLVNLGSQIIKFRVEFLRKLVPIAKKMQETISDGKEILDITYSSSVISEPLVDLDKIREIFAYQLELHRQKEIKKGISLIGPHRDDLTFYLNKKELKKYGSQGQQRTAVLALKLAELRLFYLENADYPLLLLDDVMSELDDKRRNFLLEIIRKKNIQTFITGANKELLDLSLEKSKVFIIDKGCIKGQEE